MNHNHQQPCEVNGFIQNSLFFLLSLAANHYSSVLVGCTLKFNKQALGITIRSAVFAIINEVITLFDDNVLNWHLDPGLGLGKCYDSNSTGIALHAVAIEFLRRKAHGKNRKNRNKQKFHR